MEMDDRVRAGAAFLDKINPNWDKFVSAGHLNMAHCEMCVLGQLEEDFEAALDLYDMTEEEAIGYGFFVDWDLPFLEEMDAYRELTRLWRELIKTRQSL